MFPFGHGSGGGWRLITQACPRCAPAWREPCRGPPCPRWAHIPTGGGWPCPQGPCHPLRVTPSAAGAVAVDRRGCQRQGGGRMGPRPCRPYPGKLRTFVQGRKALPSWPETSFFGQGTSLVRGVSKGSSDVQPPGQARLLAAASGKSFLLVAPPHPMTICSQCYPNATHLSRPGPLSPSSAGCPALGLLGTPAGSLREVLSSPELAEGSPSPNSPTSQTATPTLFQVRAHVES